DAAGAVAIVRKEIVPDYADTADEVRGEGAAPSGGDVVNGIGPEALLVEVVAAVDAGLEDRGVEIDLEGEVVRERMAERRREGESTVGGAHQLAGMHIAGKNRNVVIAGRIVSPRCLCQQHRNRTQHRACGSNHRSAP